MSLFPFADSMNQIPTAARAVAGLARNARRLPHKNRPPCEILALRYNKTKPTGLP
jgi:hypothetical protein